MKDHQSFRQILLARRTPYLCTARSTNNRLTLSRMLAKTYDAYHVNKKYIANLKIRLFDDITAFAELVENFSIYADIVYTGLMLVRRRELVAHHALAQQTNSSFEKK